MYLVTFKKGESIKLYSGKQHFVIKPNDLENFLGNRGRKETSYLKVIARLIKSK